MTIAHPEIDTEQLAERLNGFEGLKVLLIGDIVADHYIKGTTSRISREAPVLILKYQEETVVPGQVGNTAANIAALGGQAFLCGIIGSDGRGDQLLAALGEANVHLDGVLRSKTGATLTKTRILAGGHHTARQQVIRIDDDERLEFTSEERAELIGKLRALGNTVDAIIVSDYGYGVVDELTWAAAIQTAAERNIPVVLDSRYGLTRWKGASLITPNEEEAVAASNFPANEPVDIMAVGREVRKLTDCRDLIITRGNEGMILFPEDGAPVQLPIFGPDECTDVTGAGDTVVATATLSLASGASSAEAMVLSNLSGALVVMKIGTATVSQAELRDAMGMIKASTTKTSAIK